MQIYSSLAWSKSCINFIHLLTHKHTTVHNFQVKEYKNVNSKMNMYNYKHHIAVKLKFKTIIIKNNKYEFFNFFYTFVYFYFLW